MTQSATPSFELHAGALRLALRPDLGGCIAGLWHRETPILRSTGPPLLQTSRAGACYPLVPYSNRLAYCKFRWRRHDYTTQPNFDDSPHSLHGVGWKRPWEIVSSNVQEVVLAYRHTPDADWPFAFEATQYFSLTPQAMGVQMVVVNTDERVQPVGIGWHPYFVKRERSRLHIDLAGRWESDAAQLPVRKVPQPGIDGDVAHLGFDNCFEGWTGPARIRDEKFRMQLTSSVGYLVVYTPKDKPYFCVEPVSHVSNAIHMADPLAHGLRALEAGERFEASFQLEISAL